MASPAVINLTFGGLQRGGGKPSNWTDQSGQFLPLAQQVSLEIKENQSGQFLDPAQQILLEIEENQKQRKRDETRHELERIRGRIGDALEDYESRPLVADSPPEDDDISFALLEDPEELYELLSDPHTRSKYQQSVTVFVVGYEEKCEDREQVLQSLHDFFQEMQSGNTQKLLDEISSEEVDVEAATGDLEGALQTAQSAAQRLLEIKREMGQLVAVVSAYPDTKKGRKKMEKALLKAQEEVRETGQLLLTVQAELKQSSGRCQQLQQQVEAREAECTRLRKTADQVKTLQLTNDSLKAELSSVQFSLKQAQADLDKLRSTPVKEVVGEVVRVDEGRVKELEASLALEKEAVQRLTAQKAEWEGQQGVELEALKAEHGAELQDMRDRYEEQLRSLAVDDGFGEAVSRQEEGSTVEVEEEETAEEVAATPPEHEPPPQEQERGGAQPPASESYVQELKAQQEEREKKLREELSDLRTKSRKTATALRAQLAEAQNTHSSEMASLRSEVSSLGDRASDLEQRNATLQAELSQLQAGRESAEAALERSRAAQLDQEAIVQQLRLELSSSAAREAAVIVEDRATAVQAPGLVDRSAQWSELSGQSPPVSQGASPLYRSMVLPPMIPMDEVFHDEPVSTVTTPFQATPLQASLRLTSLDQSVVSLEPPCGSPLQLGSEVSDMPRLPQHSLSMLGRQSRLSHQSPFPQLLLSSDHPIVTEWSKVYDMVVKFRDTLVAMFTESAPHLAGLVEDLQTMEVHQLDRSQEVQGQITQMRFSLTLLLHQMEQTLGEGLARLGGAALQGEEEERKERGAGLEETVTQLQRKLRQSEETHRIELQESKETIANLSSKVESLRVELAALRRSMPQPSEGEGTIMFTRLDSERNTRTLKDALERERLSPSSFDKVASGMEQYLSIPPCRLAHMSRRYKERAVASRLIQHVQKSYSNTQQATRIIEEISELEEKRGLEFALQMDRLSAQRLDLARSLTHSLGLIEKSAGVFLIKPVFAPRGSKPRSLITPIARALPTRRPISRPRTVQGMHTERGPTPHCHAHPSMRLVSGLLHSRQVQRTEQRMEGSSNVSGRATPHPLQRGGAQSGSPEWRVDASRSLAEATPTPSPSVPRLVELEVSRHRQTEDLLSRLLPGRPQRQATPMQPSWRSPSPPRSRLTPLKEASQHTTELDPFPLLPLTGTPAPLPPIQVPAMARTDGLLAVT